MADQLTRDVIDRPWDGVLRSVRGLGLPLLLALAVGALTAGSFLEPPGARAVLPAGNLVLNPGAEDGQGAADSSTIFPPPMWTITGALTAVQYGAAGGYPSLAVRDSVNGGTNFFSGGNTVTSTGEQLIDVSGAAPEIDARGVTADLRAHLGGYSTQEDNATVAAAFEDQSGSSLKSVQIGPVTASDRAGQPEMTTLLLRSTSTTVPAGVRRIRLTLTATTLEGSFNDGYADNVSLVLAQGTPPPELPPPTIGRTANAEPDRGTVLVKLPRGGGFIPLADARQVPVGSTFDTTKGTVRLSTAATGAGSAHQDGLFSGGRFVLQQTKKNPLTTLSMTGGGLGKCATRLPTGGARKEAADAAKRGRRLFSDVKGRFRTRGRNSTATVRGTKWTMTDTCAGTRTAVKTGSVTVRDFTLRKTRIVKAGHSYLARAPKAKRKRG